ncbi:MAG: MOSC N-terminal beta barrel domain-containing protein [Pseudomonadota bacterium]|nr:MOSC N-terminal beta barrel domain-containing protein [Pseudomonadota bacterium]
MTTVAEIFRYPVKGLSPERLASVDVQPGTGMPHDREYAIAHASAQFDPMEPKFLPKTNFLQLMQHERLATLQTRFDPDEGVLTILRGGRQLARGNLTQPIGRSLIEQFLSAYMKDDLHGAPRLVTAPGHSFTDCGRTWLSLINLESVRDIERVARRPVNPMRFRGNVYLADLPPWQEFDWIDREVSLGPVRVKIVGRIDRCGATNVDPETAERDMQIPKTLQAGFGHVDCGVYAEVLAGGTLAEGDAVVA